MMGKISVSVIIVLICVIPLAQAQENIVEIPFGAYDPTFETPVENWYEPPLIKISVGDTVTWKNLDREGHTITSGDGSGRFGWMGGQKFGTHDGLFDSDRFIKGQSWSHTFEEIGVYNYFCTIHPWMEAIVFVGDAIPDYPHDEHQNRIKEFPIIAYTGDKAVEIDLTWEPDVILTHEKTIFVYQTYDPKTNTNLDKMQYLFTIVQNGVEIYQDRGLTTIGGDFRNMIFEESGPIEIIFEEIISGGASAVKSDARAEPADIRLRKIIFTAIVYDNPQKTEHHELVIQPAKRVQLQYEILVSIIVIPGAIAIFAVLYMIYKKPKIKTSSSTAI